MKTGVQNVTFKIIDQEVKESLAELIGNPEIFHGTVIEEENEIEVSGKKYSVMECEGKGKIGLWTKITIMVDASETPIDMVIALDTSYSTITTFEESSRFDLAVNGIIELIGQKSKQLIAGILAYGVDWEMSLDMTNVKSFSKKKLSNLEKDLREIKHKGKAAAGTALNGASEVFSIRGLNDVKVVVLLSDGADEIGPNPLKEADNLVSRGIYIYPFYFGEEKDQKSLTIFERIAGKSHTRLFSLYSAAEQEKRRLIRASLMKAEQEDGDDGSVSESADVDGDTGEDEGETPDIDHLEEGESEKSENESEDELDVPTGSDLLLAKLRELGKGLPFIIQEGGRQSLSDEDPDIQVIKAGIPVEGADETDSSEPTFKRTPKIIDAIKHFIEWVKGLIW